MTGVQPSSRPRWLVAIRHYLIATAAGNLIWETAQLPLYTLWRTESFGSIASAVLHCSAGDIVIATVALVAALVTVGNERWPDESMAMVAAAVIAIGLTYTIGSEYLNTVVRGLWTYSEWMPTVPWIGTGLAPLAQWIVIPSLALVWSREPDFLRKQGR